MKSVIKNVTMERVALGIYVSGMVAAVAALYLTTVQESTDLTVRRAAIAAYCLLGMHTILTVRTLSRPGRDVKEGANRLLWAAVFTAYTTIAVDKQFPDTVPISTEALTWTPLPPMVAILAMLYWFRWIANRRKKAEAEATEKAEAAPG